LKTFCISHVKDVDGIGAAALVIAARRADFVLTDYENLIEELDRVPKNIGELVLCDLGTDDSTRQRFIEKMVGLASRCKVTYIDHHFLPEAAKKKLTGGGVRLVHDGKECASMLTYLTFKDSLPEGVRNIALFGAVTDYMDSSETCKKMMEKTDRQYILVESTLLALAVARMGDREGFPQMVARELAKMKQPHEIDNVAELALEQLKEVGLMARQVRSRGRKIGRLAYMKTNQYSTGNVAKLLIAAFDVPVGASFKEKQKGWCEVSLRGTSECRAHLGKTIGRLALKVGGSGGGHKLAAGCHIPSGKVDQVLRELSSRV
jgi:single-stranded-DNA-specific exonuclease